jgi:hypothetical protein
LGNLAWWRADDFCTHPGGIAHCDTDFDYAGDHGISRINEIDGSAAMTTNRATDSDAWQALVALASARHRGR